MSVHYLLDGYNIIHQIPHLAQQSLEEARRLLLEWIQRHNPQGSVRNKVTIVYDGQGGELNWSAEDIRGVAVYFTAGLSADDYIKNLVSKSVHPKTIIVVTNDRAIQYFVRAQGANVIAVKEFVKPYSFKTRKSSPSSSSGSDSKNISMKDREHINQELENYWIKKKK